MKFGILYHRDPRAQNHRLLGDFTSSVGPLGRVTGVRGAVQTVWLPVARSQKARFASRKRIKAFDRAVFSHRGRVSKPLLIYIPVARRTRLVASTRDCSRSRPLTMSFNSECSFWIKCTLHVSRKFSDSVRKQLRLRIYSFMRSLTDGLNNQL